MATGPNLLLLWKLENHGEVADLPDMARCSSLLHVRCSAVPRLGDEALAAWVSQRPWDRVKLRSFAGKMCRTLL